jgi:endo-1,4-beta-xylanase
MGLYKGNVPWWVVVNENIGHPNPLFVRWARIGADPFNYVRIAFRTARAADPAAKLLYNDTGFELGGARADRIFKVLKRLKNEGVPIDGIGFQCHMKTEEALS